MQSVFCQSFKVRIFYIVLDYILLFYFRARRDYWENLKPASGRPYCPSLSEPDQWGVTAGHGALKQHKEKTTEKETGGLKSYTS